MSSQDSISHIFGRNVKRVRLANSLSQEQLGDRCGLHRTYISDIELGNRNPTLQTAAKIAQSLDVDIVQLLIDGTAQ